MLAQKNPQIEKAVCVLKELTEDERIRLIREAQEKAEWDQQSRLRTAKQEGVRDGYIDVAKNLLQKKMPIEDISDITGLPCEEIEALTKES